MADGVAVHIREHILGIDHTGPHRVSPVHTAVGLLIGRLDAAEGLSLKPGQHLRQTGIAAGGGPPVHMDARGALIQYRLIKYVHSHIGHLELGGKELMDQSLLVCHVAAPFTSV